jgi:hypothetical protein
MSRSIPLLSVGLAALLTAPALAADYPAVFRPAYTDGSSDEVDPLGFEMGLRYWYSRGSDTWSIADSDFNSQDTTQAGEAHLRIDDYSTGSYVKGLAGYSFAITGDATSPYGSSPVNSGRVGYIGGDFGYSPFGPTGTNTGLFGIAGYQYWNESPNTGRENFSPITTAADVGWALGDARPGLPGDSEPNNVDIHALRLGISGKAEVNDFVDVGGELAIVPYAWVSGTFGAFGTDYLYNDGVSANVPASATSITGSGYGAMTEVLVGMHPTDNMTVRLGGRAWYLQGNVESTFTRAQITAPQDTNGDGTVDVPTGVSLQEYIDDTNPFSLLRYGALAEFTYKF